MLKFRFGYATLLIIILTINHTHQSTIVDLGKILPPTQQIAGNDYRSPISIIRIKPVENLQSGGGLRFRRKEKSNVDDAKFHESTPRDLSSLIVIKPVLSPVADYTAPVTKKKVVPKFWKKMTRRPKFLHDIKRSADGAMVSRVARVHLAPGAYPVYYGLAKTNGLFGKIKSVTYAGVN